MQDLGAHNLQTYQEPYLEQYNILSPLNHGFRSKFSCETQLLLTRQDLLSARDNKIQTDLAILDFSKAFDTVPHERLLGKLEFYGIQRQILQWTAAFLGTRDQQVVVDGHKFSASRVESGAPQGTILGPLLFLLHINDLPSVASSQVRLFTDDCLLYRQIRSQSDSLALQQDLSALEGWGKDWGMRFNPGKCNIMHMAIPGRPLSFMYSLCGQVLQSVDEAKYLGVTIPNELKWSPHVNSVANKASSTLDFLRRNLRRCPTKLKEATYISLVHSTMEYAAAVWDPHLSKDVQALERVQRRAARFFWGDYQSTSSVTTLLAQIGLTNLERRRRDLRLALLFKVIHGHVAVSADDLGLEKADPRTRSNHPHKYRTLASSTNILRYSFTHRTVPEWNALPASTVEAGTPDGFKAQVIGPVRLIPHALTPPSALALLEEVGRLTRKTRTTVHVSRRGPAGFGTMIFALLIHV